MSYFKVTKNVITMLPSQKRSSINDAPQTVPTTCVNLPENLIFIDCGVYPESVAQFRIDMEKKFAKRTTHLLLTHAHWDHIMALEAFKDVNIVATESTNEEIRNLIESLKGKNLEDYVRFFNVEEELAKDFMNTKLFIPNIPVQDHLSLTSNGNEVIFQVIGGHSIDSAYIYVPHERVICTGDNLVECYAQILGNPEDVLRILNLFHSLEVDKVIPGHGNVVEKEFITRALNYYEKLISVLEELAKQKLTSKKALNHTDIPEYFGKDQPNWVEGCFPNANWIETTIRSWYMQIKRSMK